MRYIVNNNNYVTHVSFGYPLIVEGFECTEYIGSVPSGYNSLEEWYLKEELTLWRWKIIDGNLTLDSSATPPTEGKWGAFKTQSKVVTPTNNEQTVKPDSGYDALSQVQVNAIPSGALSDPSISINASSREITVTSKVGTSGYLESGTSQAKTFNLDTYAGGRIGNGVSPTSSDIYSAVFKVNTTNLIGFYLSSPETNFRPFVSDIVSYPLEVVLCGFYQKNTFTALYTSIINEYGDAGSGLHEKTIECSVSENQITISACLGNDNTKLYPIYKS